VIDTLQTLRQYQLVILRRLRSGPLTEFELAREIADSSAYSVEQCAEHMQEWLDELRAEGLIWSGMLSNLDGRRLLAAALTRKGRELVA
jgi:DNA-binding PadR family transcriptional regulator